MTYKKQFAVKALKRILEIQSNYQELKKLGVDLINYENGVSLLEESIGLILFDDEEKFQEHVFIDVQWFLYENVKKEVQVDDTIIDVSTPEAFIEWLSSFYQK
jgi:hypothetical protein